MQKFIKILFFILLFFLPLSFAGTESWSFFIFQAAITFIFCYFLITNHHICISNISKIVMYIFSILIVLGIIQSFNQHTILDKVSVIPFSLCPFYTAKEVSYMFTFFIVFFITTQLFQSYKQTKQLVLIILLSSITVMLLCLFYPKGEYINFFLGKKIFGAFGSFVNRNSAGAFLSLSFFVSLSFLLSNIFEYRKNRKEQNEYTAKILLQTILSIFFLFSVIFVRSRGGMFSTFISVFFLASLFSICFTHSIKTRLKYLSITIILFILSSICIYNNLDAINAYAHRVTFGNSEQTRILLYHGAIDMLKKYPVTGVGFAAFPVAINKYLTEDLKAWPQNLHNDWLELLLSTGYPIGTLIFILIAYLFILLLLRTKYIDRIKRASFVCLGSGILSFCLASSVDFHFHISADAFLFFVVLGIIATATFHKGKDYTVRLRTYVKIPLICLSFLMLYFSFNQAMAWKYIIFGENLILEHKLSYYEKALTFSKEPRYMQKLIITYYNTNFDKNLDFEKKEEYKQKAHSLSEQYLQLYPFDSKISKIYSNTIS